jgi:methionyl-tRNA synthetase
MGKEIIRFHAVYWPAFLMAAGIELPKQIVAHGWLLFEQEKMSKSKGNVAYPEPIVRAFDEITGAKVGNDTLRYYLLRDTVFGQDGNFSREALITRYNADLANGLGNLASRVLTMIQKYCDGIMPVDAEDKDQRANSEVLADAEFFNGLGTAIQHVDGMYMKFDFDRAIGQIWNAVGSADLYLSKSRPWALAQDASKQARLNSVLWRTADALRAILVMSSPVIPETAQKLWEQLGQSGPLADQQINKVMQGVLKSGTKIGKPEGVFPRIDKKEALERIENMENEIRNPGSTQPDTSTTTTQKTAEGASTGTSAAGTAAIPAGAPGAGGPAGTLGTSAAGAAATSAIAAPVKIGIEDFAKVELRVGVVKSAEKIAGADKLLKVMVDIGDEVRQVLAGIAPSYAPEELVGRKVVVVTNLAPRKMRGVESNGMLLAASAGPDGKAVLCTFAEEIPAGAKVK